MGLASLKVSHILWLWCGERASTVTRLSTIPEYFSRRPAVQPVNLILLLLDLLLLRFQSLLVLLLLLLCLLLLHECLALLYCRHIYR
jgi:hypothetical protein